MTEDEHNAEASGGESAARVRTAGETPAAGHRSGPRPQRTASPGGRSARPRPSGSGAGARLLAPVALVICAIAVFSVLSSGESKDDGSQSRDRSAETGAKGDSAAADGGGDGDNASTSDGGGATEPVRATYRVKPGDTFSAIAEKTGVDVDRLAELNPEVDPRALQSGEKLKLK